MDGRLPKLAADWRWVLRDGLAWLAAASLAALDVVHAFTTRMGGTSAPPYDTLNLGRGVGDRPEAVRANRARVLAALGRALDDHVEASQVHGAAVAVVGAAQRGRKVDGVDALATRERSVVLAMHCADCVPVLLADPVRGAVAAVHTGWRGTASGAAAATVAAMAQAFGSRPADLVAAIGPTIGPCCYEVDAPVLAGFAAWPWRDRVFRPSRPDRWSLDLPEANRLQLVAAGVRDAAISAAGLCTSCHAALFFSHRRDGRTGRMGALIALAGA
ncbi:MAG: peptidoglycan editing factor PgeF [Armatimonadota bacterium]|nr:peptidoglycan editing factor PgeF [Armatimonadota bacterium]MDR7520206.1 peptidoglycan editing factor PgeF [Armatimonadota bacterium]